MMIKKWLKNRASKIYLEAANINNDIIKKNIENYILDKKNIKLLDTSCWDYKNASKYVPNSVEKYGTDFINVPNLPLDLKFDIWNPNKELAPYEDNFFDLVTSNMVWEHLSDIDNYIDEIYRITKKGGRVIISTNNLGNLPNILCMLLGWTPFDMQNFSVKKASFGNPFGLHVGENIHPAMTHKSIYMPRAIKEIGQYVGFKHIKTDYAGYFPGNILSKIDPKRSLFFIMVLEK